MSTSEEETTNNVAVMAATPNNLAEFVFEIESKCKVIILRSQ